MSDIEQEDEGLVENPEPESDAPAEADAPPEAEAGVGYQAAAATAQHCDGAGHNQGEANQQRPIADENNSLAEGEQNIQRPPVENENSVESDRNGGTGATASNELQENLEAEDEQYYQNIEVNFAGAEWSLEPEENSQSLGGFRAEGELGGLRAEGEGAEGGMFHEDTAESEQESPECVAGHHRTESSCHLEEASEVESGAGAIHQLQAQNLLVAEADGASASVDEAVGNMINGFGQQDESNCAFNEENEPTESDQALASNSASNIMCNEGTPSVEGMPKASRNVDVAVASINTGNGGGSVSQLPEGEVERSAVEGTETGHNVTEDKLNIGATVETKSNETLSCQPECDQSSVNKGQNESSQNPEGVSEINDVDPRVDDVDPRVDDVDPRVGDESCDAAENVILFQNINKSVSGVKTGAEVCQIDNAPSISASLPCRQITQDNLPSIEVSTEQNIGLDLNKEQGAIPKHTNSSNIVRSESKQLTSLGKQNTSTDQQQKPTDKENHTDNQLETNKKSTENEQTVTIDSEEELLSELDATLQSVAPDSKPSVPADKGAENSAISLGDTSAEEENISCEQCLRNNLTCSLSKRRVGAHNIPEARDLKRQYHQAKQLLLDRECEICRLKADVRDQKERITTLCEERDACMKDLDCLKHHNSDDLYIPQIKELEYTIAQQQNEVRGYKEKLSSHDAAAKRAIATLQAEMKLRIDQVTKQYEEASREKDSMVVKYAQAEHKNMECRKAAERAEGKVRDLERERDTFMGKMRAIKDHRTKVGAELDAKVAELNTTNKELDKHRELLSSADVRVKWAQNKLKAELDAHKETKVQLERMQGKIRDAKEETAQIRADCQAMIKTYQESEEVKSNSLDKELKQKETELLVNLQQKTNFELAHVKTQRELEHVRGDLRDAQSKNSSLAEKIASLEAERDGLTATSSKHAEVIQKQKRDIQELRERIETLVQYRSDFARAEQMITSLDAEISELKLSNKELLAEMEGCRRRETDNLELTEKLSRKNAQLQSDNTTLSNKIVNMSGELQATKMDSQSVDTQLKELSDALESEQRQRKEETQGLTTRLAGKSKAVEDLTRRLEEEKDEIKTLKRKHGNNIKDLTRQLQQVRRKLESHEATTNGGGGSGDTVSMGSRTSSNGSLNTVTLAEQTCTQVLQPHNGGNTGGPYNSNHVAKSPPEQEYPVITEQVEVDKQALIERIVKLQRASARKNEKIEFMDDHIAQLVDEIQKKNRIIQSYVLKEDSGTMTSNSRELAKAEISRKHSIMGSVYSSHSNDGTMTLDLSLEINRKLQAVLEDTLLKNMTLKGSLDTLGQEIARLSQENRTLQLNLQGKGRLRGNPAHR